MQFYWLGYVGCYTHGSGIGASWDTLVDGLTSQMATAIGAMNTSITNNNNVLVMLSNGMTIESCISICTTNGFLYAGLINT